MKSFRTLLLISSVVSSMTDAAGVSPKFKRLDSKWQTRSQKTPELPSLEYKARNYKILF
jgi:hypothetical protein